MGKSMKGRQGRRIRPAVEMTEAEWEIMKVVWEHEPCAAGTVQEEMANSKGWAYATVKTTMDRKARKGFLKVDKIRNLQLFSSCITQVDAKRLEFRKMLKRAFDGALTPMMQFLIENDQLSEKEYYHLEQLIKKRKHRKTGSKRK